MTDSGSMLLDVLKRAAAAGKRDPKSGLDDENPQAARKLFFRLIVVL